MGAPRADGAPRLRRSVASTAITLPVVPAQQIRTDGTEKLSKTRARKTVLPATEVCRESQHCPLFNVSWYVRACANVTVRAIRCVGVNAFEQLVYEVQCFFQAVTLRDTLCLMCHWITG